MSAEFKRRTSKLENSLCFKCTHSKLIPWNLLKPIFIYVQILIIIERSIAESELKNDDQQINSSWKKIN